MSFLCVYVARAYTLASTVGAVGLHSTPAAIGIEHVNDYTLIRFVIRFERKFPIRRSLIKLKPQMHVRPEQGTTTEML